MERGLKITAIVLFFLIMGFFLFQAWLGHKVASVIEEKGSQISGGVYNVTVDDARVSLFGRSVTISGIIFKPDSLRMAEVEPQEMIMDFSIDGVYASGFNLKMIRGKAPLKLRVIEIDRPVFSADIYETGKDQPEDTTEVKEKKPFEVPTHRLRISDGTVVVRQHSKGGHSYQEGTDINIDVRERKPGKTSGIAGYFDGGGSISRVVLTNLDASVDTIIDSIAIELDGGRINIGGVEVKPRYAKEQFVYKNSRHRDWTAITAKDIRIGGLDIAPITASAGSAVTEGKTMAVSIDSVYIGAGSIESYKDRNAYQPYWVRKLIFESVWELPVLLLVKRAVINDMDAVYSELPKTGSSPGVINFTNLSGTLTGLSNIPSSSEPYYTLDAHGFIYGAAPLNATFHFPKSESTNRFEVTGSLGALDLRNLNKTVIPLAKAEVETGQVDRMTFHIVGDRHTASVDMELLYHDLKVDLVKIKENNQVKERKFLSWIANEFVIKESNPSGGETRRGTGTAERELDRSQFNFLWRTLLEGIKESAGL